MQLRCGYEKNQESGTKLWKALAYGTKSILLPPPAHPSSLLDHSPQSPGKLSSEWHTSRVYILFACYSLCTVTKCLAYSRRNRVLQRHRTNRIYRENISMLYSCVYTIYKELAHVITEAGKFEISQSRCPSLSPCQTGKSQCPRLKATSQENPFSLRGGSVCCCIRDFKCLEAACPH